MVSFGPEGPILGTDTYFPFLAQGALVYLRASNDIDWARGARTKIGAYIKYYEDNHKDASGLFFWNYCWSGGVDNDVSIAFVPNASVCPPNINSLVYLEYLAMEQVCRELGDAEQQVVYAHKADTLKNLVNRLLWSDRDKCYAPYRRSDGEVSMDYAGFRYAFLSSTNLMPLYAGIAPADRAEAVIDRYITRPEHFASDWGIRSLSKSSIYYNNAAVGNPPRFDEFEQLTTSNWQGPVWVITNYFVFRALLNYGQYEQAHRVMTRLHKTLAEDIRCNGVMHENYDAETGSPLYAPYFGSWNVLADLMPEELERLY